jgi:hypothetical protein
MQHSVSIPSTQSLVCVSGVLYHILSAFLLFMIPCCKSQDPERKGLHERWLEGVRSMKEKYEQTDAVIEYFDLRWQSISFDVTWARILAGLGGAPARVDLSHEEYQKKVLRQLRSRGVNRN